MYSIPPAWHLADAFQVNLPGTSCTALIAGFPIPDVARQGLTLVHFSAQLESCLSQEYTLHTLHTPYHPLNTGCTTPYVHPLSLTKRSS